MDFIYGIIIQIEVVRATVGILQRQIVGDQGNGVFMSRLVTAEHVEVRTIDFRSLRDKGSFPMAGGKAEAGSETEPGDRNSKR